MTAVALALVAAAGLAVADHDAQHTLLVVASTLGLFAAGVGHLLRWRITSTAATRQVGGGLLLLGLHQPVAIAVAALVGGGLPGVPTAAGLGVLLVAGGVTLRAFPCRGLPPVWRLSRRAGALLAVAAVTLLVLAASPALADAALPDAALPHATGLAAVLAGGAWLAVAVAAWRSEPLASCQRGPSQAIACIATLVALSTVARAVPAEWPAATDAVRVVVGAGLVTAAAVAGAGALRRLTAALAGQERYVAGLLEQLAGHERQLQEARACLHDSRATVAGVRAAASAVQHLGGGQAALRADLEESVASELGRLERLLRLPGRAPAISAVDLDGVIRPLVVSHRERGLRVSWAPTGAAPVTLDGDALAVILGNLLGNALAHAPRSLCRVGVTVTDRLTVTVADDGPGLSRAGRATAFEAGVRRTGSPGEGLGLAISRDLARRHGGDLVAAETAAGTCFVLTLPVRSATPSAPPVLPRPRSVTGPLAAAAR